MMSARKGALRVAIVERITAVRGTTLAWMNRVVLAVLDQGLMSGSNFVIGILLARWLSPDKYGGYALAFSIFMLLSQFYMSFVLEPMAVFGGSAYRTRMRGYLGALLWLHLGTAALVCLLLGGTALAAQALGWGGNLPGALAAVMVAGPCIQLFWLVRRAFYTTLSPATAVIGAAFYSVIVLGGLVPIYRYGLLSSFAAFSLMGFGALLTSGLLLLRLKPTLRLKHLSPSLRETWAQHWQYGRWALATSILFWMPSGFYYLLLASSQGIVSAGELRVLLNFVLPVENLAAAVSLLLQSHVAQIFAAQGAIRVRSVARKITLLYIGGASVYWGVLILSGPGVMHLLYGEKYDSLWPLMPWLALASVATLSLDGPTIALRAMQSPAAVFAARAVSSCVTVVAGIWLTATLGLFGALVSMFLATLACLIVESVLLKRTAGKGVGRA